MLKRGQSRRPTGRSRGQRLVFIDLKIATLCQKLRLESAPQSPSLAGGSERLPPFCRPGPCPGCLPPAAGAIDLKGPCFRKRQIEITCRGQFGCEPPPLYPRRQATEAEWGRAAEHSLAPATGQPIPTKMPCRWRCAPQPRDGGTHRRAGGTHHATWSEL